MSSLLELINLWFWMWQTAYPYALKAHLVLGQDLAGELQNVLKPAELEKLMASSHRPNHVVQIISDSLASVYLTDFQRTAMVNSSPKLATACSQMICHKSLSVAVAESMRGPLELAPDLSQVSLEMLKAIVFRSAH